MGFIRLVAWVICSGVRIVEVEGHIATVSNTVVVDLGAQRKVVEDRIKAGTYASADEVIQAGLRALAREEDEANEWLVELAEESLADPGPDMPAEEMFAEIYAMQPASVSN